MKQWILGALTAAFAALYIAVVGNFFYLPGPVLFVLATALVLLGLALVILTLRGNETGKLRFFLILTGFCAVGMPVTAMLHNFGFHAYPFIVTLSLLPAIFVIALAAGVMLLAMAEKPVPVRNRIFVGGVFALLLSAIVPVIAAPDGGKGYEVRSEAMGSLPDGLDRLFVTAQVDDALTDVVYHSFEHSLISALESNGITATIRLLPENPEEAEALDIERKSFAPDATMRIRLVPLYRTHRRGFEAIVGTVFEASLEGADSGQELWRLTGKVDYVANRFFNRPGFTTGHGMKKEFAWHTTAAIVRSFMVDVLGRESKPIYTVTEERERRGQRTD